MHDLSELRQETKMAQATRLEDKTKNSPDGVKKIFFIFPEY